MADQEYINWAKAEGDVVNCKQCKSRITKIRDEGCNHMTCAKCGYQWCWLCGATFKEDHFDKWNLFGCRNL